MICPTCTQTPGRYYNGLLDEWRPCIDCGGTGKLDDPEELDLDALIAETFEGEMPDFMRLGVACCPCEMCRRPGNGYSMQAVLIDGTVLLETAPRNWDEESCLRWLGGLAITT